MFDYVFYKTKLPSNVIDSVIEDLKSTDGHMIQGTIGSENNLKNEQRNSKVCFLNSTNWMCGFVYHYIMRANIENFGYDILGFHENKVQYSEYGEGCFYDWHIDFQGGNIINEYDRKISFSLQLSDPEEYEGGELQLMDSCTNKCYFAPEEKGTLIIFDSKIKHRVRKVKSGCRKSLVGWIVGPRFR